MFQTTNQIYIYIYCHNKSPYVNPQPCSMCRDTVAETRPLWPSPGYASRGWLGALLPEMVFQHGQCPIPQRKKLIDWPFTIWLVVDLPLWKIWKSVGMMTFPIYGKIKMFQTTNQTMYLDGGFLKWGGTPNHPILVRFSIINHPFGVL